MVESVKDRLARFGVPMARARRGMEQLADEQGVEFSVVHQAVRDCIPLIGDPDHYAKMKAVADKAGIDINALIETLLANLPALLAMCM